MVYEYYYGGMHLVWWIVWFILLSWVFILPYNIPGQRFRSESPLEILENRLSSGEITQEEFDEKKRILDSGYTDYSKTALYRF
jgi:putative membrane protein